MKRERPSTQTIVIEEEAQGPFRFKEVALAHGWVVLAPFVWDEANEILNYTLRLPNGEVVMLAMSAAGNGISVRVESPAPLSADAVRAIRRYLRRMWRLDDDLSEFHQLRQRYIDWPLRIGEGGGRILRAPRLFDDIVYTICTTNINWSGTKRMVSRLLEKLGDPFPPLPSCRAFPEPARVAEAGVDYLQQEVGLGYRSQYIWQLASDVADDTLDLDWFEQSHHSVEAIQERLLSLRGIGPYAAATLLTLLGYYGQIAIDSEARAFVSRHYLDGEKPTDAEIRSIYQPWGRWQQLAYWFDAPEERARS